MVTGPLFRECLSIVRTLGLRDIEVRTNALIFFVERTKEVQAMALLDMAIVLCPANHRPYNPDVQRYLDFGAMHAKSVHVSKDSLVFEDVERWQEMLSSYSLKYGGTIRYNFAMRSY